jgi:hypothetical protein
MDGLGWQCVKALIILAVLPVAFLWWLLAPREKTEEVNGW